VFLAWLNGLQDHFLMIGGQESARHCCISPSCFASPTGARAARSRLGGGADDEVIGGAWMA